MGPRVFVHSDDARQLALDCQNKTHERTTYASLAQLETSSGSYLWRFGTDLRRGRPRTVCVLGSAALAALRYTLSDRDCCGPDFRWCISDRPHRNGDSRRAKHCWKAALRGNCVLKIPTQLAPRANSNNRGIPDWSGIGLGGIGCERWLFTNRSFRSRDHFSLSIFCGSLRNAGRPLLL